MELIQLMLPAESALIGSAVGFYFGSKTDTSVVHSLFSLPDHCMQHSLADYKVESLLIEFPLALPSFLRRSWSSVKQDRLCCQDCCQCRLFLVYDVSSTRCGGI